MAGVLVPSVRAPASGVVVFIDDLDLFDIRQLASWKEASDLCSSFFVQLQQPQEITVSKSGRSGLMFGMCVAIKITQGKRNVLLHKEV